MPTNLESVVSKYLRSGNPAPQTRKDRPPCENGHVGAERFHWNSSAEKRSATFSTGSTRTPQFDKRRIQAALPTKFAHICER